MIIFFFFFIYCCSLPVQDSTYRWWPDVRPTQYTDWRAKVQRTAISATHWIAWKTPSFVAHRACQLVRPNAKFKAVQKILM